MVQGEHERERLCALLGIVRVRGRGRRLRSLRSDALSVGLPPLPRGPRHKAADEDVAEDRSIRSVDEGCRGPHGRPTRLTNPKKKYVYKGLLPSSSPLTC